MIHRINTGFSAFGFYQVSAHGFNRMLPIFTSGYNTRIEDFFSHPGKSLPVGANYRGNA
jgi:hypothetical protein